jgi:hypothetical protein
MVQAAKFTIAQIAHALGKTRQAVRSSLANMPPSGAVIVQGVEAAAWTVATLSERLRVQLADTAARRGFRDITSLLEARCTPWASPIDPQRVQQKFMDRAVLLREAMAAPLARHNELTAGELAALGVAEFCRVFDRESLSAKQWKRLYDRTVLRDGGAENWQRLEIYLDDAAFQKAASLPKAARKVVFLHRELDETINNLENKQNPTADDRKWLFDVTFAHYERLVGSHPEKRDRRAIKSSLIAYLHGAIPALSKTPKALRRVFEIHYKEWIAAGRNPEVLTDRRKTNSGFFRRPDFTQDNMRIAQEAVNFGGSESLAHRQLRKRGELSPEYVEYYPYDIRHDKSHVPRSTRDAVTSIVEAALPLHRSEHDFRMAGPYISRDWSGIWPGDWISGDDVTWNHYWFDEDEIGGINYVGRGECLLFTDLRSHFPLTFCLIPGRYNGQFIRSSLLDVHDKIGLPRVGGYWEQGVWKSRWMFGERARKHARHWRETEKDFKQHNFQFEARHATTPRAKPIEGLLRILQERMRNEPGFVGFNERLEKYERMQDFLARVRNGKEHPANELLSKRDWGKRIEAILGEFAHEPQQGKMLDGQSPSEMWYAALERRPLRKLADTERYILASHAESVRPGDRGIKLKGVPGAVYCSDELGALEFRGREMRAYYNIECPELATVATLDHQRFFTVKRIELPALSASKQQLNDVTATVRGYQKPVRAFYGTIPQRKIATIARDGMTEPERSQFNEFHTRQIEQAKATQAKRTRQLGKIARTAAVMGAEVGRQIKNPDRVQAGLELEKEARERIARKQQATQ